MLYEYSKYIMNKQKIMIIVKNINFVRRFFIGMGCEYSVASEPLNPLQRAIHSER